MALMAITRGVSPSINRCELSYHAREPIDFDKAVTQHHAYEDCLRQLGIRVVALPAEPELPDSVFVEDAALVLDEIAVIPIMGAASRRSETKTIAHALQQHRLLKFLTEPATLDGGDVLLAGRKIFVGLTKRTNCAGVDQLREILRHYDYEVIAVEVRNILHLKSACSYLGDGRILIDRSLVDERCFAGFELVDDPDDEPGNGNVLELNGTVIVPASFPKVSGLLEERGFRVKKVDVLELQDAEAGVSCCSLIFAASAEPSAVHRGK